MSSLREQLPEYHAIAGGLETGNRVLTTGNSLY
jgi:hypothetical protein